MTVEDGALGAVWDLLEAGEHEEALVLAERRLSQDPDDVEALHLAGCALADAGRLPEGEARVREALRRDPDYDGARESLAGMLYATCRFEEGAQEAQLLVRAAPEYAPAHYLLGVLLDMLGQRREADEHIARASRLDPEGFPAATAFDRKEFDAAVEEALEGLPEQFRRHVVSLPILVEDVPTPALLAELLEPSPDLLGLFVGVALPEQSHADLHTTPTAIYLFKRNLERASPDRASLVEEIRVTLLHEVGHYLGMDEDDLHDAGYG